MKIRDVRARWIQCPIAEQDQHVSDFGRITSFDAAIISVETDSGLTGWGEAKAGVGSSGPCKAVVEAVNDEFGPALIGLDPMRITSIWDLMYNGPRTGYAIERGRGFPVLGRRGVTMSAMSGVDMALWDLLGKAHGVPVATLWGGPRSDTMPAYASGGWADVDGIGDQLNGYVERGFSAVKMRVGIMDGDVATSVDRVLAAREALGPDIELMADAHGTYNSTDAMRFAAGVEEANLRWFEEPVNADDIVAASRVRASTRTPIAAGESEATRFDFRELINHGAVDVLQPDLAICGGPTEARRIAALAETHQLELAPHCWGSALSFNAGVTLAFTSSAARIIEYSLGGNPLLREMPIDPPVVENGVVQAPTSPGFGIEPRPDFLRNYER